MANKPRPVPADFEQVAPTMSQRNLSAHYNAGRDIVRRWIDETKIERKFFPCNKFPVPADFEELAATMHRTALMHHYEVSDNTLARWIRDSGVVPVRWVKPSNPTKRKRASGGARANLCIVAKNPVHPSDEAKIAADRLRKLCPVMRCDENGKFNHFGRFWRVGNAGPLTDAEIIARAAKHQRRAA